MKPEEKIKLHIWWMLKRIKEKYLATPSGMAVQFDTGNSEYSNSAIPTIEERNILMWKLDKDFKVVKILEVKEASQYTGFMTTFTIKILQPKFDEIFYKYEGEVTKNFSYNNENEVKISRDSLLKIKRVLDCIQKKREISPSTQTVFEFEGMEFLEAGQGLISELEVESIMNKICQDSKGISYELAEIEGDIDTPSPRFMVTIIDSVAYKNYHKKISEKFYSLEPSFQKIKQEEKGDSNESTQLKKDGNPFCEVINGTGYLRFNKHGEKIKIGGRKTRHFKLLQFLLDPIGVYKTIESVFEKIQLPKDTNDQRLWDANTGKTAKITIIQNSIKELQKDRKLKGKIIFTFNAKKTQIKAELR